MRLGIGSYTYGWHSGTYGWELTKDRDHLSVEDLVRRAAEFDVPVVQIVNHPALDQHSDDQLKQLSALANELGVEIEVGTVGCEPSNLENWLHAAQAVGARIMRTIFTEPSSQLANEKAQLKEVLPQFKAAGVSIAIENHETSSYQQLLELVQEIGDEHVGVCLDTVNSLGRGEGTWEVADALLPVTLNLHVKDFTVTRGGTDMGFTVTGARTGEGKLDIPRLLERMHACRPDVSVILEQWTPLTGDIDEAIAEQEKWAVDGVRYLKNALGRFAD